MVVDVNNIINAVRRPGQGTGGFNDRSRSIDIMRSPMATVPSNIMPYTPTLMPRVVAAHQDQ